MPPRPTNWAMYGKMAAIGIGCCIGGPALVYYITPTEDELFKKYNPELQKRSLENRIKTQEEFDHFANKLKEYSKSNKTIWQVRDEDIKATRERKFAEQARLAEEARIRKELIRKEG